MRLAVLCWEFPPRIIGGLGTYASEIIPRFIRLGHDVTLFTLNDGKLKTHEIVQGVDVHRPKLVDMEDVIPEVVADDIRKWGPGIRFFSDLMLYNLLSSSKLVNELVAVEHRDFDAVVAHDWLSIMGGLICKRELSRRLIFHIHSTERGRSMGDGSKTVNDLEYLGGQKADAVITVSYAMRDELLSLGFPELKIHVVYNGVDPDKYDRSKVSKERIEEIRSRYDVKPDEFMILFVGRMVAVKGVDRLVQSMKYVIKKIPKAKLILVGTSDMQYAIQEIIRRLGLESSVKTRFEFISEDERIAHYAASDLCVFPSLYEPFGIVALEAMSMERPVVVGAKGTSGMKEIVVSGGEEQSGVHIDPYNPADIAWGITTALRDPERARQMGRNGRKMVLETFNWNKVAEMTIETYENILAK